MKMSCLSNACHWREDLLHIAGSTNTNCRCWTRETVVVKLKITKSTKFLASHWTFECFTMMVCMIWGCTMHTEGYFTSIGYTEAHHFQCLRFIWILCYKISFDFLNLCFLFACALEMRINCFAFRWRNEHYRTHTFFLLFHKVGGRHFLSLWRIRWFIFHFAAIENKRNFSISIFRIRPMQHFSTSPHQFESGNICESIWFDEMQLVFLVNVYYHRA